MNMFKTLATIVLGTSLHAAIPHTAFATDLKGIWEVDGFTNDYGAFRFFIDVKKDGSQWVATKLNSSRFVPRGREHFRGTVSEDALNARVQIALPGFREYEWRRHTFELVRDSTEKVTRINLTSGQTHYSGADGERSIQDQWTYRRWPDGQFRLLSPKVVNWGYQGARNDAKTGLNRNAQSTEGWQTSLQQADQRLTAARTAFSNAHGVRLARQKVWESAWLERVKARRRIGQDEALDTTNLPGRLRVLYRNLEAEKASIRRSEKIILDHQNNVARQAAATIATLFSGIDSSRANIRRLRSTIESVRQELGLGAERNLEQEQRDAAADAQRKYDRSIQPYYDARLAESLAKTELELALGQVELAQKELAKLAEEKSKLEDRLKLLDDEGNLVRIEGYVDGDPEKTVYQAVPSGLDVELRRLREVLGKSKELLDKAQAERKKHFDNFKAKVDEGTQLRNEVAELIWDNALKMAGTNLVTKSAEFGIAFATGGPVGLAIEMVATPVFQNVFNEQRGSINSATDLVTNGGVIFTNYDETRMQNAFRRSMNDASAREPDPEAACRGLNLQIEQQFRQQVFNPGVVNAQVQRAFRSVAPANSGANTPLATPFADWQHQSMQTLGLIAKEATISGLNKVKILQSGYDRAQQRANARVAGRVGLAVQQEGMQQLAQLDSKIASQTATAAERSTAVAQRAQLLQRLAGDSPDLAQQLGRNAQQIEDLVRRIGKAQAIIADEAASAGYKAAARNRMASMLARLGQEQGATRTAIGSAAAHINWGRTLAHQTQLMDDLAKELAKLSRIERLGAKLKLRNTGRGTAVSIVTSLVFGAANNWNQGRLQEQERALWHRIFSAELEQSLRFKVWQRASCIYWAVHDAYNAQRRMYAKIYGAYDPETGFDVKQNDPFKDHQQLNIKLVYEPVKTQGMRAKVGTVNCPESSRNTCRIAPRGLAGQQGPHLPLDINLSPEQELTQ